MNRASEIARWFGAVAAVMLAVGLIFNLAHFLGWPDEAVLVDEVAVISDLEIRSAEALKTLAALPAVPENAPLVGVSTPIAATNTEVLALLRDASVQAGAQLLSSQILPPVSSGDPPMVIFRASGTQLALLQMSRALENDPLALRFDSFEVAPSPVPIVDGQLELSGILRGSSADAI